MKQSKGDASSNHDELNVHGDILHIPSKEVTEWQGCSLADAKSRLHNAHATIKTMVCHPHTGTMVVEYKPTNEEKILILLNANW